MTRRQTHVRVLCFVMVLLASQGLSFAAEALPFTLGAKTSKGSYLVGEPISFTFTLTNSSDEAVECYYRDNEVFRAMDFFIRIRDGSGKVVARNILNGVGGKLFRPYLQGLGILPVLQPGQYRQCQRTWRLSHKIIQKGRATHHFLPPGKYSLVCAINYGQSVTAAPIDIEIQEPTGREKEASVVLFSLEGGSLGDLSGIPSKPIMDVARRFPDTIYAKHIRFRAVLVQMKRIRRTMRGADRASTTALTDKLIAEVSALIEKNPAFPLAPEAAFRLGRMYKLRQDVGARSEMLDQFTTGRYKDSPWAPIARKEFVPPKPAPFPHQRGPK